ncbi:MAG: hypothetical protein IJU44_12165, partial [Kiritimatiellae bacterium]|nr:hypothetical protein [Kiritimatiellia bacterium]
MMYSIAVVFESVQHDLPCSAAERDAKGSLMPRHSTHFNNLFLAALRRRLSWETALLAAAALCAVQVGGTKG